MTTNPKPATKLPAENAEIPEFLFEGKPKTAFAITGMLKTEDYYSEPYVRCERGTPGDADYEVLNVPLQVVRFLGSTGREMGVESDAKTDDALKTGLMKCWESTNDIKVCLIGHTPKVEGTPFLAWKRAKVSGDNTVSKSGWGLSLAGTDNLEAGFAEWDDEEAICELIESMKTPKNIIALSGLLNPTETSKLSARMAASALKGNRSLPRIDIPLVREILETSGLIISTAFNEKYPNRTIFKGYRGGAMRLLTIKVPGTKRDGVTIEVKKVPVAIAVQTPQLPYDVTILDLPKQDKGEDYHSYNARKAPIEEANKAAVEAVQKAWADKAINALAKEGWRSVDLPHDKGYHYPHNLYGSPLILWFTRIPEALWTKVAPAAKEESKVTRMNVGSDF
jgi:hypothetical protein